MDVAKKYSITFLVLLMITITLFITTQQKEQYRGYESILSQQLANDFSSMATNNMLATNHLEKVIKEQNPTMTKSEAQEYYLTYLKISNTLGDYETMAVTLKEKEKNDNLSLAKNTAADIATMFSQISQSVTDDNKQLTTNDIEQIKLALNVTTLWKKVLTEDLNFVGQSGVNEKAVETYKQDGITKTDWYEAIIDLNDQTKSYLMQKNLDSLKLFQNYN